MSALSGLSFLANASYSLVCWELVGVRHTHKIFGRPKFSRDSHLKIGPWKLGKLHEYCDERDSIISRQTAIQLYTVDGTKPQAKKLVYTSYVICLFNSVQYGYSRNIV